MRARDHSLPHGGSLTKPVRRKNADPGKRGNSVTGAKPGKSAKERIVEAACGVLGSRGSHDASVKEIAKAAGVAPGLVHYYFASKEALLLEVVRASCALYNAEVEALVAPSDPRDRAKFLLSWTKTRGLESPDWYRMMVDLDSLALRDRSVAAEVSKLRNDIRTRTARLVASVEQDLGLNFGGTAEGIASVLVAAVDGLTVHKLIDPSFAYDQAFDALFVMIEGLMGTSTSRDANKPAPRQRSRA
jgi:AcrR family transcriptional regulator